MSAQEIIKQRLAAWQITPAKSMGQNFLVDDAVYAKLVATLAPSANESVIEIGPGLGTLTEILAQTAMALTAIEKDDEMVIGLRQLFTGNTHITIVHSDILQYNIADTGVTAGAYSVIGNIPYYLTGKLLRVIMGTWPRPRRIVFMVQREVGERITARPPDMSMLAVAVQLYGTARIAAFVPAQAFAPRPTVNSCIIVIDPAGTEPPAEIKAILRTAKAGFSRKRGQLINTLTAGLARPKESIVQALTVVGIDLKQRAETLTVQQWRDLPAQLSLQS